MFSIRTTVLALSALIGAGAQQALASGVSFTCNSNINTLATADGYSGNLCSSIQSTIGTAYAGLFTNANANIYIEFTNDAGLGASTTGYQNTVSYSDYLTALTAASSGDAVDTAALASLPATESTNFSSTSGKVNLTSALAQALGFTTTNGISGQVWGVDAPATSPSVDNNNPSIHDFLNYCNVLSGSSSCYNGVIYLQDPGTISNDTQDYYYGTGTLTNSKYDIFSIIEHEADELLGTASCVETPTTGLVVGCSNSPSAVDLFRYTAPGTLAAFPTTDAAYFSYNGGATNVAWYNHAANGEDYADFNSSSSGAAYNCRYVQDAEGCLGGAPLITTDGGAEVAILDAVGYNTVPTATPEPGTVLLLGSGIAMAAVARLRRRRQ